jgi:hypothetical protein
MPDIVRIQEQCETTIRKDLLGSHEASIGERRAGRWISVAGIVVRGHGVASGIRSAIFPGGTIRLQAPHFLARGLDISSYHPATINLSIAPWTLERVEPRVTLTNVRWAAHQPPEDFSLSPCRLTYGGVQRAGLVYYPHPETKPAHHQDPSIVEVLAPYIDGLRYGHRVDVALDSREFAPSPPPRCGS